MTSLNSTTPHVPEAQPAAAREAIQRPTVMSYLSVYGPYAFGVVSLLMIWYLIVGPELNRNRLDFDRMQAVAEIQSDTAKTLQSSAETLRSSAATIQESLVRLGMIAEQLERMQTTPRNQRP